ncbi:MFS transporter [soil metagenome]
MAENSHPTDHGHSHLGLALVVISAAQLMVVLDATIINIALPFVKQDLGFSDSNLTWMLNAYTLAFGGLLLLGGRMGDLLGRRKVFIFGVLLFSLASFLGGIAQSESIMLAARALQGVGAAAAAPTALALITTTFPAGPSRNRAFAVYAAMSGAGAAVGLILGGALTELDWRLTFFINVPIGLLVAFVAPRVLAESAPQPGKWDLPGAVTATVGLVGVVYGLTHKAQPNVGWGDAETLIPLVGGLIVLVMFVIIESRSPHALLPLRILADRTRAVSFITMLIVGAAMFAMFYFLSLYIQIYLGYSALQTGFAFLPFSFGIVFAAQTASTLISRVDPRWISGTGALLAAGGMWIFHQLDNTANLANLGQGGENGTLASGVFEASYFTHIFPGIVILSFGLGLLFVPLTLTAVAGVDHNDSGVGSAVLNTVQQIGGALGLAVLGTLAATRSGDKVSAIIDNLVAGGTPANQAGVIAGGLSQPSGYTYAFAIACVMFLVMAVVIFVGLNIKHQVLANDGQTPEVHLG